MEWIVYLIKSAGVLSLFYLIYIFLLRGETLFKGNRHFLLSGMLVAVLFPLLKWTRVTYVQADPANSAGDFIPIATETTALTEVSTSLPWNDILFYVYLVGVLALSLRFGFHLWSLFRLIHRRPRFKRQGFTYVKVDREIKPFSFFRLIVFNPEMHKAEELQMVLAHEQAHVRQLHSIDLLLSNLLIIVQWWNPLTWLYRKSLEENLEFLADHDTAQRVQSIKQYQLALVRASSSSFSPMLINSFYQSFIKKRILMLNKPDSKQRNFLKAALILPALAVFLWSFNVQEEIQVIPSDPVTVGQGYPPAEAGLTSTIPGADSDVQAKLATTTATYPAVAETIASDDSPAKLATTYNSYPVAKVSSETIVSDPILATGYPTQISKVIVRIDKNTSEAQLKEKQMYLKEQGINLDYDKLDYNDQGELTGISLSISSDNANSNYNINGDEPISEIIISISDNGIAIGSSEGSYRRALEMQKRYEERAAAAEARGYARAKEREAMMAEREMEMKERLAAREEELARRLEDQNRARVAMAKSRAIARTKDQSYAIAGYSSRGGVTIDKDTTDEELARYKQELARHGVEFNYKRVKRNDAGEIISLKYTVKKNGEESQTSIKSNGQPIKRTRIGY
ncbi:M56 family metallopeptidase [Aureitalea marina]|uniref:Peptidase M56 domain-containing protein n=1 Tax=Aureitalea marina TaxID=930804 RepID=A0A2S7KME6_9FLAO|nr:M56 family metallopeptidase [Aureitalea marina]PQB03806.1 hypothetical protein BST85_01980 [Aureitalea marina]